MIYAWIWRKLPGPKWLKGLQALAMFALALFTLWFFIFPNVNSFFSGDPTFSEG